jgi:hypothetical protein
MIGTDAAWERMWAPYDEESYQHVLRLIPPGAAVLEIGAGDLRLARRIAGRARIVYAIEIQAPLLAGIPVPDNLRVLVGDARSLPFPGSLDVAVLLMRHCTHFALYREKLAAVGCRRLITNARWRMGVESIDLTCPARPFNTLALGWYACRCGATGFKAGPLEQLTGLVMETVNEVDQCPECKHHGRNSRRFS